MKAFRHPYIRFGAAIVLLLVFVSIFAGWIAPYVPDAIELQTRHQPPSWRHWFGTDEMGRDVFSRTVYGARISLGIGVSARTLGLLIGLIVGCISGYYGGKVDMVLQRLVDMTLAFPFLLLAISIAVIFSEMEHDVLGVLIALSAVMWASLARIMRSQIMMVKERDYVAAARAFGASDFRIIVRYILPTSYVPALIWWTMGLAQAIMAEAGLSFLGLGAQPPTPSWGGMINYGSSALRIAPWVTIFPGAALALTVLGFNLLGEGLRDVLDVRRTEENADRP